jgi:outer membrane protein OmpA-like peptidoglycan-associated protein
LSFEKHNSKLKNQNSKLTKLLETIDNQLVHNKTRHFKTAFRMKISRFIIPILLLFAIEKTHAQPLSKLKDDALLFYQKGKYAEALELLTRFDELKTGDLAVQSALGVSAYQVNKLPLAKTYLLQAAAAEAKIDPSVFLILGRVFHAELNFREAVKYYKKFLAIVDDKHPERRRVVGDVRRCAAGLKIVVQPELALVENLGENVNSRFDELAPIQSPTFEDRLYFSAGREDSEGGLRDAEGKSDPKNGRFFNDIYFTEVGGADWSMPSRIDNQLLNTARNEQLLDITNEGKTLIFFRSLNNFSGDILVDTFKTNDQTRNLPPMLDVPMKPENGDNSLYLFNDSLLIFSARNRTDGLGGSDLYYAIRREGIWFPAKNLGSGVNSPFDETAPFLAKDGRTLYFSSNSYNSMGGFDIFRSRFDDDSLRFLPAENLGKGINSSGDDLYFRLTPDGLRGYFSSTRKDGFGGHDLYNALFKTMQREQGSPLTPIAFHLVEDYKAALALLKANEPKVAKITEVKVAPLFYDVDEDLLRGGNLKELRNLLQIVKQFPSLKVVLTVNSTVGEKTGFDLYFSMKRVEKVAKYLIDNGLQNEQILLKSVGAEYPIAQSSINGQPNPAGDKLNRRVDIELRDMATPPAPVKVNVDDPIVSQFMVNTAGDKLKQHRTGLSYKVFIIASKRIYDNEILAKYGDAMMETSNFDGNYLYTVGLSFDYAAADKMRRDLLKDNIRDAVVVPYMDGMRLGADEAKKWTNKYPDLLKYLATLKKP